MTAGASQPGPRLTLYANPIPPDRAYAFEDRNAVAFPTELLRYNPENLSRFTQARIEDPENN
jgi:hypothetical protein